MYTENKLKSLNNFYKTIKWEKKERKKTKLYNVIEVWTEK